LICPIRVYQWPALAASIQLVDSALEFQLVRSGPGIAQFVFSSIGSLSLTFPISPPMNWVRNSLAQGSSDPPFFFAPFMPRCWYLPVCESAELYSPSNAQFIGEKGHLPSENSANFRISEITRLVPNSADTRNRIRKVRYGVSRSRSYQPKTCPG